MPTPDHGPRCLLTGIDGEALSKAALTRAFRSVFLRYFGYAIGPHAARHIAATDYIKKHPANLLVAAVMLNDTLETVRRQYVHLLHQDHFRYYDQYTSGVAVRTLRGVRP